MGGLRAAYFPFSFVKAKMDEDQGKILILLIQTLLFVAPVIAMIWKAAGMAHQIKENKKDIDGIGVKVANNIHAQQSIQIDLTNKITAAGNNIIEILTTLQFMKKDIDELKKEIKEHNNK